jgi:hypothetical protein
MSAWQAADTPGDATALARSFERVAQQYGPAPTWWWSGERLDRARLEPISRGSSRQPTRIGLGRN